MDHTEVRTTGDGKFLFSLIFVREKVLWTREEDIQDLCDLLTYWDEQFLSPGREEDLILYTRDGHFSYDKQAITCWVMSLPEFQPRPMPWQVSKPHRLFEWQSTSSTAP